MDILGFSVIAGLSHQQVDHSILLIFIEYLVQNGLFYSNVANDMTGICSQSIVYGLNTAHFQHESVQLFQKSKK